MGGSLMLPSRGRSLGIPAPELLRCAPSLPPLTHAAISVAWRQLIRKRDRIAYAANCRADRVPILPIGDHIYCHLVYHVLEQQRIVFHECEIYCVLCNEYVFLSS
eukprot:62119-Pleurochrysis_carterae.AAC.5